MIRFLVHNKGDSVGVVTADVKAGDELEGRYLDAIGTVGVAARQDIPLGHKIALKDLKMGETVIKYGHDIGEVTQDINPGDHVHVHNLKTKRW